MYLRYARPRTPEALPSCATRRPSRRDAAPARRSAPFAVQHPYAEACRPLARLRDTKAAFAAHETARSAGYTKIEACCGRTPTVWRVSAPCCFREAGAQRRRFSAPRRRRSCPAREAATEVAMRCGARGETKSQATVRHGASRLRSNPPRRGRILWSRVAP